MFCHMTKVVLVTSPGVKLICTKCQGHKDTKGPSKCYRNILKFINKYHLEGIFMLPK